MKTNKKLFLSILALSSINFSVIHAADKSVPTCFAKKGDNEFDSCASCSKKASWFSKSDQETCCQYLFDNKRTDNKTISGLELLIGLNTLFDKNFSNENEYDKFVTDVMKETGCDKPVVNKAALDVLKKTRRQMI